MRIMKTTAILMLILLLLPWKANAQSNNISSTDLIEKASLYDGTTVSFGGEVVGDILYRGSYAWIGVDDGANTISISIPASEAKKIAYVGRYRTVGDTVQLTGTFHRACAEHGGDLDLHADAITVVEKGHTVQDDPSIGLLLAAGACFLCALTVTIFVIRRRLCYNRVSHTNR
ncbi:MAG: hypothetical protein VB055_10565 [Oscillospiraceae bacterium]|nr:hypothetical protein [Oscillospiraceae bacterium]